MSNRRRALNIQFAAFIVAMGCVLLLSHFFSMVDVMSAGQRRVTQWGSWGAVAYPFLFAACNLLLLPGGIVCVGSGFFFGLWWGFFLVLVGNVIAAAIAFAVSRFAGREWFRQKILQHPKLRSLEPAVEKEGWKIVVLSQLHPFFPTSLVNYLFGLTRIPFRTYMVWVAIGRAPGIFLYVYLGTLGQFGLNLVQKKTHPRLMEYWIWGGAFVVSAIFLIVLSRIAIKTIEQVQDPGENATEPINVNDPKDTATYNINYL